MQKIPCNEWVWYLYMSGNRNTVGMKLSIDSARSKLIVTLATKSEIIRSTPCPSAALREIIAYDSMDVDYVFSMK